MRRDSSKVVQKEKSASIVAVQPPKDDVLSASLSSSMDEED